MTKNAQSSQRWAKPDLVKLGKLKDVAGANVVNGDGKSANLRDPAPS